MYLFDTHPPIMSVLSTFPACTVQRLLIVTVLTAVCSAVTLVIHLEPTDSDLVRGTIYCETYVASNFRELKKFPKFVMSNVHDLLLYINRSLRKNVQQMAFLDRLVTTKLQYFLLQ